MIGIYGGTFNPVHFGHLRTALEIKHAFQLTEVRLMPCHLPAHRQQPEATAEQRLQMLELAIANCSALQTDRRELDRDGPSYMLDSLCSLRAELGDAQRFLLIIGTDSFANLEHWHAWQQLFDYAHLLVMHRPDSNPPPLTDFFRCRLVHDACELDKLAVGGLIFQAVTQLAISATQIRKLIANGENPQFLLPDSVLDFINQNQLYQTVKV